MSVNPFVIGDRVTLKGMTYHDGTVVDIVNENTVRVYWRKSITGSTVGVFGPDALARKT